VLARNLAVPWAIAFLPDGDALVTERDSARLLRVTPHGRVSTIGTVPGVEPSGEGGLLGVAVSPSFGQDRVVYLYVSTAADNRIVRFRYSGSGVGPLEAVVTGIPRASIHNGGRLAFGPDGMLWASTGEHAEPGIAQDKGSLGGKILRMTDAELTWRTEAASPSGAAIAAGSLWVAALRGERLWQSRRDNRSSAARSALIAARPAASPASAAACAARCDSSGSSPPSRTLMSTRQAALRAEAAASSAPVTASPRRFGLPASATWRPSCATRAPIPAISSGTRAAPSSASGR